MGGTFDPVHNGHLHNAAMLNARLGTPVRLVVAGNPGHRSAPIADAQQRLQMVRLAVDGCSGVLADDREISRTGKIYTVDTLVELRQRNQSPIAWVVGADALPGLHLWRRWSDLLHLAHLIVISRPGVQNTAASSEVQRVLGEAQCHSADDLHASAAGRVLHLSLAQLDISASSIRARLARGECVAHLLPPKVNEYIHGERIYAA